jgi:predicted esterase
MTAAASASDLHLGQPVLAAGAPLETARLAVILLHGRGADAADILALAGELGLDDVAYLAPQAANNTWYPYPFLVPTPQNEPWLSSALESVERCVRRAQAALLPPEGQLAADPPADRIALLGFSQGACLALEYAARRPRRYAALLGLSGGLIGSEAEIGVREQALRAAQTAGQPAADDPAGGLIKIPAGGLDGTPVFMGCSDADPHIPAERFRRSAEILKQMGASVTARLYPNLGHTVNLDELEAVRGLLQA